METLSSVIYNLQSPHSPLSVSHPLSLSLSLESQKPVNLDGHDSPPPIKCSSWKYPPTSLKLASPFIKQNSQNRPPQYATNPSPSSRMSPPSAASADAIAATSSSPPPPSSFFLQNLSNLGLGYAIAIALGVLVLLSSLLLASYVCFRSRRNPNPTPNGSAIGDSSNGIVLPRIIFVAEDDDDDDDDAERGGPRRSGGVIGLDPAAINSYPKFPYSASKGGDSVCSICLCEYKEGEMARMMPDCKHFFHLLCIDAWLKLNASCPVCRTSPMPTPMSTPLSEVVPLSQFAADRRRR